METTFCVCSPQSTRGNLCFHNDGSGSSSVSAGSTTATPLPNPAIASGEEEIVGVEGGKVFTPLINGKDGRFVLDSLPPWTHFFFSERSYYSLPVEGVIVPDQLGKQCSSTAATSADHAAAGLVPSADGLSAVVSSSASSKEVAETNGSSALQKTVVSTSVERADGTIAGTTALSPATNANIADSAAIVDQTISHPAAHVQVTANNVWSDAATAADLFSHGRGTCETLHDSVTPYKTQEAASRAAIAETLAAPAHSRGEDEDGYWHLLHDTLMMHGGVSDLQYFVSTDGSLGSHTASAAAVCAAGSIATPAEADTKVQTCAAAANGTTTEGKGGAASNCHESSVRELQAQQENSVRQRQETLRLISEQHKEEESSDHLLTLCRVSRRVCGHKGVAHGGFIATLLDNAMGYLAQLILPRAATKSLTIDYLKPLLAETLILVEVRKVAHSGTSSSVEDSKCSAHLTTSKANAGAADDTASKDAKDRERSKRSRTACCTIEGKVYTCIPEQLRAVIPLKRDRVLAEGSQRNEEGISAQDDGSVSPQKRRTEQYAESDRSITRLDRSRNGGNSCNMLKEVNGDTAGSCTGNKQRSNSFKPHEKEHHRGRTDNSGEGDNASRTTRSREAESLPAGVWLVATAEAVFVDVSAKWKALA